MLPVQYVWDTEYVRVTCRVIPGVEAVKVLGTMVGRTGSANARLQQVVDRVRATRAAMESLDDPAAELVLTRRCLDVSEVSYTVFRTDFESDIHFYELLLILLNNLFFPYFSLFQKFQKFDFSFFTFF